MNVTEESFRSWSQGPSQTEMDRCKNAESVIRKAISADSELSKLDLSVMAQGSYWTRTNVRIDSDVDICVRYNSSFFPEYPPGMTKESVGNRDSELTFPAFKEQVGTALQTYFGSAGVTRGKKAFDVHANTYRIDADVVPTFVHRKYTGKLDSKGNHQYLAGVAFRTDDGVLIKNWPQQSYENGVARNDATGRKYKRVIRILKRLRYKMQGDHVAESMDVSSFLIECLVWNASLEAFRFGSYTEILQALIANVWSNTRDDDACAGWNEVNEVKKLFQPSQPWTRAQANSFLAAAWHYIGYK